jgi:ferredoxin
MSAKKTLKVDRDVCIGASVCVSICPKVFELDDEGKSHIKTTEYSDCDLELAVSSCPSGAISLTEE